MFTKEELDLIDSALTEYWLKHNEEYERQKAKGRKKCGWHLSVLNRISNLQSKIFYIQNSMIGFDIDSLIKDMEQSKYTINTIPYVKGCNDVLDYYINKLKKIKGEAMQ